MIDFGKYNIKIQYFASHPAGTHPISGKPFIVSYDRWWDGKNETWNDVTTAIEMWCEEHRNQILAIHKMDNYGIRYAVIGENND